MENEHFLEYNCSIDLSSMPKCTKGTHCSQCDKSVFDYTKMNLRQFELESENNQPLSTCGSYRPIHVDNIFHDWRNNLARFYRRTIRKSWSNKLHLVYLPIIAIFFFVVSCGRRTTGVVAYSKQNITKSERSVRQATTPIKGSIDKMKQKDE